MTNKTKTKKTARRARQRGEAGRPAYHFHSKYRGLSAEQIEERVRGRVEPKVASKELTPPARVNNRPKQHALPAMPTETVTLIEGAKTVVREGTLRSSIVEALRSGRGTMTVEALSKALKQDARPVISKLAQKGWIRRNT